MVNSDDSEDTEVYGTFYENPDGLIRYYHPIDSEEFVRRRRKSISFTSAFYEHLRRLADIHKDIDHRLCGGGHSHPNGIPKQSPADKRFNKRIWRNERNQMLIIGVAQGDGPSEWEVVDDGYEVQRQSNGHLIRVRAYAGGTNNQKKFRVHTEMGG
jgi:proteasome lid subunit RPN8/RPN11